MRKLFTRRWSPMRCMMSPAVRLSKKAEADAELPRKSAIIATLTREPMCRRSQLTDHFGNRLAEREDELPAEQEVDEIEIEITDPRSTTAWVKNGTINSPNRPPCRACTWKRSAGAAEGSRRKMSTHVVPVSSSCLVGDCALGRTGVFRPRGRSRCCFRSARIRRRTGANEILVGVIGSGRTPDRPRALCDA